MHQHRLTTLLLLLLYAGGCRSAAPETVFEVLFPPSLSADPVTGRVFVLLMRTPDSPARTQRSFGHQPVSSQTGEPFFAADVDRLQPGAVAVLDADAAGFPFASLADLPAGTYYAQALLNRYTRFERGDGHVIWAHMDQWEGQHFNWAPGNFISSVQEVQLSAARGYRVRLQLSEELPPVEIPPDSEWVQRVKIQSQLLTRFWGHPIFLGATVLLPRGYHEQTDLRYPTIYYQGHFSLEGPFGFSTQPPSETEEQSRARRERALETGYEFYQSWNGDRFPRMVGVTFQHPTPYFDDSYAVNSANNGPYADALLTELIPHLEEKFRLIRQPYARVLTGGSTGGYEALALQVHHPRFFGGTWVFYPDPIDFRRLFQINIYDDENAFLAPGYELLRPPRYAFRSPEGQPLQSIQQLSQLHAALGTRGRSTEYLEAWEAAFGPTDAEGYPRPLWNRRTGLIDKEVARYWKEQGYDLTYYLQQNWSRIGPDLAGKIRVYCGDMDHYYFNLPVYFLQEFLESARDPHYGGSFEYGRPSKGHGWRPMSHAQLVQMMADHISAAAPAGEPKRWVNR